MLSVEKRSSQHDAEIMVVKLYRLWIRDAIMIVCHLRAKITSDHQLTRNNRDNTDLFTAALSWERMERAKGLRTSDIFIQTPNHFPQFIHTFKELEVARKNKSKH